MPRNVQLARTWTLIRRLEGLRCGLTLAELAQDLGVCQRTIRRDLEALGAAGFPLVDMKIAAGGS